MLAEIKKKGYKPIKHWFGDYEKEHHNRLEKRIEMAFLVDGQMMRLQDAFKIVCSFEMRLYLIRNGIPIK